MRDKAAIEIPSEIGGTQEVEVVVPDTAGINESVPHHQDADGIMVTEVETIGKVATKSEVDGAKQ